MHAKMDVRVSLPYVRSIQALTLAPSNCRLERSTQHVRVRLGDGQSAEATPKIALLLLLLFPPAFWRSLGGN